MAALRFEDVPDLITLIGPEVDPDKTTVFSIFRDEMYFCPAFFAHYRSLGVTQFIILDDQSEDGTTDFLDAQPDCIRVAAKLRFGIEVDCVDPGGKRKRLRAGTYFKGAIPRRYMPDRFVTYVDADEFLIPPPQAPSLPAIEAHLARAGAAAAMASLVEFFPKTFPRLTEPRPPADMADLIASAPYFEAEPLIRLEPGANKPAFVNQSKSVQLMAQYGLLPEPEPEPTKLQKVMRKLTGRPQQTEFFQSPRHKTPVVRHGAGTYMVGSHNINHAPAQDCVLSLAHFVFTDQFRDKVARAIGWGAHAHGASKYHYYARLIEALDTRNETLLGPRSQRYAGPQQLMECGLMRWTE